MKRLLNLVVCLLAAWVIMGCSGGENAAPVGPPALGLCAVHSGERGIETGDVLPNFQVLDCQGAPIETDAMCGPRVRVIADYCGWCPISLAHGKLLPSVQSSYGPAGVQVILIVVSATNGGPPTSAFCQQVQDIVGPDVRVFFDPTGAYKSTAAVESDTWYIVTDHDDGGAVNSIVTKANKPNLKTWLEPILDSIGDGNIEPSQPTTPEELGLPFCLDMVATGLEALSPVLAGPPRAETSAVVEAFCQCVVAGREADFLSEYLTVLELNAAFDGLAASLEFFRDDVDYPAVYVQYLAACTSKLDVGGLETLAFGPDHHAACTDSDSGKDAAAAEKAGSASGLGLTAGLLVRLAFDRTRATAFQVDVPFLPHSGITPDDVWAGTLTLEDRCVGTEVLQEHWCDGNDMRSVDVACSAGCEAGRCKPGGGAQ